MAFEKATAQNYSCKNGFQLEKKGRKYQCIQPAKISYRELQKCNNKIDRTLKYELKIDKKRDEDLCVLKNGYSGKSFKPNCQHGYSLKVRRGKDACNKLKPKIIIAPSLRSTRN